MRTESGSNSFDSFFFHRDCTWHTGIFIIQFENIPKSLRVAMVESVEFIVN